MRFRLMLLIVTVLTLLLAFLWNPGDYNVRNLEVSNRIDFGFWANIWASFFSAILFTVFLFFLNEKMFRQVDLSGVWVLQTDVQISSTVSGFTMGYKLFLLQKSSDIEGRGEKKYDVEKNGKINEYLPSISKIVNIEISGVVIKRYLGKSEVRLSIKENGSKRDSYMVLRMYVANKDTLIGQFSSTAATSYGEVKMTRCLV